MKNAIAIVFSLFLTVGFISAQQVGSVSGFVYDQDDNPVAGAHVMLSAEGWHGGHHGGGPHGGHDDIYTDETEDDGSFDIDEVSPGDYHIMASLMGYGHAVDEIEIMGGQNTEVNLYLEMGGHDGNHNDSLVVVDLTGWAVVVEADFHTHYFLDIDGNDELDYRLSFGPDWYSPDNGATRPADGDSIWVTGGLMGYSEPQTVVVYEINGLFWREPGEGHGGHGGNGGGDCPHPDSVTLIETSGIAYVDEMPHMDMYFLDENGDEEYDYHLNFGAPWYDPGNGATRPENGDDVDIVGGLMEGCGNFPVIIVYEINGMFWRDPGDTLGLWLDPTAIEETEPVVPEVYLTAGSYPNPFNAQATIYFSLETSDHVRVSVYDILGRELAVLADKDFTAGESKLIFDADQYGVSSSAVYFYRVITSSHSTTGKMVLLK